jgi:hypothetical protein
LYLIITINLLSLKLRAADKSAALKNKSISFDIQLLKPDSNSFLCRQVGERADEIPTVGRFCLY